MDLLRTLLVYMSVLVSSAGVNSPALTPVPQDFTTPAPTAVVTQSPAPTAVPTVSPTPAMTTLSMNSRGDEVKRLQQRLVDLGYLKGGVDGVFGKQTHEAVRNFQRANKLSVDGIAGKNTLNKLYNDPNVVAASAAGPTVAPTNATLTVFYVSTTGATFNTDTLVLAPGTRTVTPNAAKVPSGYTLRSQRSVTVRVDNRGVATPASINFTYQPPALVQTVNVPIYYRSDSNQLLSQDYVAAPYGQTMTVFAQQGRVPQGFTLLTPAQLTVAVSAQGVPTPGSLTFVYRGPQVVTVVVPVFYRNTAGDLITSHMMSLQPGQHTIAANDALVPHGYTLEGAREQKVTVSQQGTATPATLTFTYKTSAITVSLPVHYVDQNGAMLHQDSVSVMTGPNTVTANDALVPGYELTSARQVNVQVDADGKATPDKVVFTYKKPAQATVSVQYRDDAGKSLLDTSVTFSEGSHTVIANDSFVPAGYVLQSAREVPVTVSADGTAAPSTITFTYKAPVAAPTATPTPAPEPTVAPEVSAQLELRYRNVQGDMIGGETITLTGVGMHDVKATTTQIGDYVITDNTPQQVEVLQDGTAAPNAVSFVFDIPPAPVTDAPVTDAPVTDAPVTDAPVTDAPDPATVTADVTINYKDAEGALVGGEVITLTGAQEHQVLPTNTQAGTLILPEDTQPVTVTVSLDGTATPAEVDFVFVGPAPTSEPVEEPAAPTVPALQNYVDATIPEGQYPIHTGPGDTYIRAEQNLVFTGGNVRLWGSQAGWVMIGYDLDGQGNYRVGYIPQSMLPEDLEVPELQLTSVQTLPIVTDGTVITEDPFGQNTALQVPIANGKTVLVYGLVGDYAYVESVTDFVRGFVPKAALGVK